MKDILKLLIFVLIYTKITSPLLSDHITVNLDNKTQTYVVQKDDNLWKIAEKYERNNKEEFILSLKELNNLENSNLHINQNLLVSGISKLVGNVELNNALYYTPDILNAPTGINNHTDYRSQHIFDRELSISHN